MKQNINEIKRMQQLAGIKEIKINTPQPDITDFCNDHFDELQEMFGKIPSKFGKQSTLTPGSNNWIEIAYAVDYNYENDEGEESGIDISFSPEFGGPGRDVYEYTLGGRTIYVDNYLKTDLNEIKIQNPSSLLIVEIGQGYGLLVEETYLFADYFSERFKFEYELIDADVEVDEDIINGQEQPILEINIPEPSFGGGASENDVNNAYDYWEEKCNIAEKVLVPYSYKHDYGFYRIKLSDIGNADLLKSYINEIKRMHQLAGIKEIKVQTPVAFNKKIEVIKEWIWYTCDEGQAEDDIREYNKMVDEYFADKSDVTKEDFRKIWSKVIEKWGSGDIGADWEHFPEVWTDVQTGTLLTDLP